MRFPPRTSRPFDLPALLAERGLCLRHATDDDLPFLGALYASTRAGELADVTWPESVRKAFLDSQFALQHRHYLQQYAEASFQVIAHGETPVGRYYVASEAEDDLIVDIALLPQWRGLGIGGALIESTLRAAQARGRGVHLHVLHANVAARRLYERLGFRVDGDTGSHLHMRRAPDPA